jgi:NADPH:quinone reductase-like Zn-dependent oxidoreductase
MATQIVAPVYGAPEVLTLVDVELPPPGPGEVAVAVRAAGTNPVDYKRFGGLRGADPADLPMPVGLEVAGVVTAVGPDADGPAGPIHVGDEVIGYPVRGGYATEVVAPASAFVPKPAGLGFPEASGLMLAGATAVHCLDATGVSAGDTVVVHGAAGGVGLMVIQLARIAGARVIGTSSPGAANLLRAMGAEPVAYGAGLLDRVRALAPEGVDVALDMVGTDEALDVSIALVADRARIATIAGFARGPELGIKVLGAAPGADPGTEVRSAARLRLAELAGAGDLVVTVAATYPLDEAKVALNALIGGHTHGKIALIP